MNKRIKKKIWKKRVRFLIQDLKVSLQKYFINSIDDRIARAAFINSRRMPYIDPITTCQIFNVQNGLNPDGSKINLDQDTL